MKTKQVKKSAAKVKAGKRAGETKAEGQRLKAKRRGGKVSRGDAEGAEGEQAKARTTNPGPLSGRVWTIEIARERIGASGTNPRKDFPEEMLQARAESLRRQGQLVNLIVRPCPKWVTVRFKQLVALTENPRKLTGNEAVEKLGLELILGQEVMFDALGSNEAIAEALANPRMEFEIADGECRWRAAGRKYADLRSLKCDVRCLSDEEMVEIQWASWLQRENLSPLDEAEGLAGLRAQGWTVERLCERFGKSKSHIFEKLKLARAEGPVRKALEAGKISPSVATLIASVPDAAMQAGLLKAEKNSWDGCGAFERDGTPKPVREVAEWIERHCVRQIPWKLDQVFEHTGAVSPACRDCPKMTRNMGEENPEIVKGPPRCMGLTCFGEREKAVTEMRRAEAKVEGLEFWEEAEFREKEYRRDYCVEGATSWEGEKSVKWEKLAGEVKPVALGQDRDGSLRRVWRRADLVTAGLVTEGKSSRGGAGDAERTLEEKVFKGVKARVLELLLGAIQHATTMEEPNLGDTTFGSLLKAYFFAELLGYAEAQKRKVESVTVEEALQEMARRLCGNRWYRLSEEPEWLGLFGIEVKGIAAEVRAGLKSEKGKKAGAKGKRGKQGINTENTEDTERTEEEGVEV